MVSNRSKAKAGSVGILSDSDEFLVSLPSLNLESLKLSDLVLISKLKYYLELKLYERGLAVLDKKNGDFLHLKGDNILKSDLQGILNTCKSFEFKL